MGIREHKDRSRLAVLLAFAMVLDIFPRRQAVRSTWLPGFLSTWCTYVYAGLRREVVFFQTIFSGLPEFPKALRNGVGDILTPDQVDVRRTPDRQEPRDRRKERQREPRESGNGRREFGQVRHVSGAQCGPSFSSQKDSTYCAYVMFELMLYDVLCHWACHLSTPST